jgi:UDP-N-acetylglucosamine--N-acetylmuramyl-(pentapeptide) pyrophosphoryl-undecaprenol N-acetylglucosamine transferase
MKKIVFTGGGSGGHIMPLVSIIRELKGPLPAEAFLSAIALAEVEAKERALQLHYIGPGDAIARSLFKAEGVVMHPIASGKVRRYFSILNAIDIIVKIPFSFFQSLLILVQVRPQLVFSKGGTGSAPVALCARLLSIPVFVHESDSVVGRSNRIVSRFAVKIFTSFPKTEGVDPSKAIVVGNPVRRMLLQGVIVKNFKKPLLLVWGGSQGAKAINDFILSILNDLLKDYAIAHICGKASYATITTAFPHGFPPGYFLHESLDELELKNLLASADVVVSRAGAGSIFEIAAFGKPSIIIPLPKNVSSHQLKNALVYSNVGASRVIEQEQLTRDSFFDALRFCKDNQDSMRQVALAFAKPDAAQKIAQEITTYVLQEKN